MTGLPSPQVATQAVGMPAMPRSILKPSFSRMPVRYFDVSNSWKPSSPKLKTLSTITCACFFMASIWPARSAFMAASLLARYGNDAIVQLQRALIIGRQPGYQRSGTGGQGVESEGPNRHGCAGAGHDSGRFQNVISFLGIELQHLDPVTSREGWITGLTIDCEWKRRAAMFCQPFENLLDTRFRLRFPIEFDGRELLAEHVHFRGGRDPQQRRLLRICAEEPERIDGRTGRALNRQRRRPKVRLSGDSKENFGGTCALPGQVDSIFVYRWEALFRIAQDGVGCLDGRIGDAGDCGHNDIPTARSNQRLPMSKYLLERRIVYGARQEKYQRSIFSGGGCVQISQFASTYPNCCLLRRLLRGQSGRNHQGRQKYTQRYFLNRVRILFASFSISSVLFKLASEST